jgi:hypothetical protein
MIMALPSFYETAYGLRGNPFPGSATYAEDSQKIYVPEMFGEQRDEFLRKFVLAPLENRQPLMGAVWSTNPGDPQARGFGKSTLMGEEAKLINQDFGLAALTRLGIPEEAARNNPVLAGYVSFNVKSAGGIANIDAAAYHLTRFILRGKDAAGVQTHYKLRQLAAAQLVEQGRASEGQESEALVGTVRARFRQLGVSIDIRNLLEDYLFCLASTDTEALERFLAEDVGTWHHDRNGLKYLQIFVVFAELAGIQNFTFFIDQVEDFTSVAGYGKIQKNVKIIRDALFESEPFNSRASFVFQLHPAAWHKLRDPWEHEDLRSLDYSNPLNAPIVVVLKGLETFAAARLVAERFLNHELFRLPERQDGIEPFTNAGLEKVWELTRPKPREFLKILHALLALGKEERLGVLDETFVNAKCESLVSGTEDEGWGGPGVVPDDRLTS